MTFDDLFLHATGFGQPYPWQRLLASRETPARVIVAPTGSGKTEAVLLDWLWRRLFHPDPAVRATTPRRLVLALPMRVLVEQTVGRVAAALRRLSEKSALDQEIPVYQLMGGAADDTWVLEPASEAVLVGTIDMLLSRALNRGFGRGRASWPIDFGLLNSDCQWVFDEIQLMDAAVATSCQLEAHRARFAVAAPARTVWMSATLDPSWLETTEHPKPDHGAFMSVGPLDRRGPLASRLAAPKVLVRAEVDPRQAERIADIVLHEHEALTGVPDAPQLTLALLNTVDRAVELYRALRQRAEGSIDVLLLHSRFRPADRERQVARLSEKELPPGGRIVVSTQVVEAGIDLDAGAMVTDLAPWASLVQRAGRLNRAGLRTSSPARLVWIDPGEAALPKVHQPYDLDHVAAARAALLELEREGFSPDAIEAYLDQHPKRRSRLLGGRPLSLFLRAPDLIDLFDTDPTLDGDDPDVGRFIRVNEDLDVGIAWRNLPPEGPAPDEPTPAREEVCPVPVSERKQIAALEPWRWSYARRRWERVLSPQDVMPGDLLLVHASRGGYDPQIGWTGRKGAPVDPLLLFPSAPPESDSDDSQSTSPGRWISLGEHTIHVQEEVERLIDSLELEGEWAEALRLAALAHDVGKAHPQFQERLRRWANEDPPQDAHIYAKAPDRTRWRPPYAFRHELVSAFLLLERGARDRALDLAAYLVAAHHGKLRLTPRVLPDDHDPTVAVCLGVKEGDEVPEVVIDGLRLGPARIDLSLFRIGSLDEATWIERALDLLDRLGPFRLAYLEALLRVADQRASRREREESQ